MPKGKRKDERNGGGRRRNVDVAAMQTSDDEMDGRDTMSVVSNCSDMQTVRSTDGSEEQEVDETTTQENFEDKIKSYIEGTSQKSAKGRVDALTALKMALSKKYIYDFISERKVTICDGIERCLKKGKGEEQSAAAMCAILLLVQLGSTEDAEEIFKMLLPTLKVIVADATASCAARAACAEALGLGTFIAAEEIDCILDSMTSLENVFRHSYCKGDGSVPTHTPEVALLHNSALSAWTLLLSMLPPSVLQVFVEKHLTKLPDILLNADVEIRISAGEAIALIYELVRMEDEEFEESGFDELCLELKRLSTECTKHRAKKDRRQQRSSFRDILGSVEKGDFTKQRIRVNAREGLVIDCWTTKTQYDAFCHALGTGMNIHLQENELLRDIFGLGPPLTDTSQLHTKASRTERHMVHDAAFKARTKSRAKQRDKKSVTVGGD